MINFLKISATALSLFVFFGCKKENMGDCFKSTGNIETEMRSLAIFNRIEVEDNVNVFIRFDDEHKAEVTSGKNLLSMIETEVRDQTLFIRNNNKCNWVRSFKKPVNVTVYCEYLDELIARGFGTVETLDTIQQATFYSEQWLASGEVKLLLNTNEVYIKSHTGPADFDCRGTTDFLYSYNSSQGILDLRHLKANDAFVWNKGTGNIYVQVEDSLEVLIESVGDIYYSGNPGTIIHTGSGSGELLPL